MAWIDTIGRRPVRLPDAAVGGVARTDGEKDELATATGSHSKVNQKGTASVAATTALEVEVEQSKLAASQRHVGLA